MLTCTHPDHDEPKLVCGYPVPCPWHTATIDTSTMPETVTIPVTSSAMRSPARQKLGAVAAALSSTPQRKTKKRGGK